MRKVQLLAVVCGLALASLVWNATASAATLVVKRGGSIQAAVDRAAPGDTLIVKGGVYRENVLIEKDGLTLLGWNAHIRPPQRNALSPCADPNHPEETIGICVFGPFFAGVYTKDVSVAGFSVSGFESGFAAVGASDALFAWNRAIENELFGFVGVFSPGLKIAGNDARGSHVAGIFFLEQHDGGLIAANRIRHNAVGILLQAVDHVAVRANRFRRNGLDLSWDGTGAGNVFSANACRTSEPLGLCVNEDDDDDEDDDD